MRTPLFFLVAALACAQSDDPAADVLLARLIELRQGWRSEIPQDGIEEIRTETFRAWRLPDGQRKAILGRSLAYVDPDTGEILPSEPVLWETDRGWTVLGAGKLTRIRQLSAASTLGVFTKQDGNWSGVALRLPRLTYNGDDQFAFTDDGLAWSVRVWGGGYSLVSEDIESPRGKTTLRAAVVALRTEVIASEDGRLTANNGWNLSRAVMVGSDGDRYPCSAWELGALAASFTCDDAGLPEAAFPYRIDPTSDYYVDGSSDDGACGALNTYYPPTTIEYCWSGGSGIWVTRNWENPSFKVYAGMVRIDTSGVPDEATITSATLNLSLSIGFDSDGRNFSGEYYAASNWPISSGDYTATYSETAFTGVDIGTLPSSRQYRAFTLLNPNANLSKTGDSGFRLHITGGEPYSKSQIGIDTLETGGSVAPYLSVTYTVPSTPHLIVVTSN